MLEAFRHKYGWYFAGRWQENKKKGFEDVMEMSSVMTNASQILD